MPDVRIMMVHIAYYKTTLTLHLAMIQSGMETKLLTSDFSLRAQIELLNRGFFMRTAKTLVKLGTCWATLSLCWAHDDVTYH